MTPTSPGRSTRKKFDQIVPEVTRLHGEGMSRAAIARELDVAPSTVGRAAEAAGISFERDGTAPATAAAQVDAAKRREVMTNVLYGIAGKGLRKANAAADADDPSAFRTYMNGVGIALDRFLRLDPLPDPKEQQLEDSTVAFNDLHEAILESARSQATPEELHLIDTTAFEVDGPAAPYDPDDEGML